MSIQDDFSLLLSHARDLCERAESGVVTYTEFLTPAEQLRLTHSLCAHDCLLFDGGYAAAQRRRLFFLPPYMAGAHEALLEEWLADIRADSLVALEIRGSSFRELAHKDYLGAILNLGIERCAVGDVCVTGPFTAILFCGSVISKFLIEHLTRVANDAVRVEPFHVPADFDGGRTFLPIHDTVASARADAVVAALAGVSRERACELLRRGLVEIDYEPWDKPDRPVTEGCVIVIRGKGKFVIRSLSDTTKKGRIRLSADKYM